MGGQKVDSQHLATAVLCSGRAAGAEMIRSRPGGPGRAGFNKTTLDGTLNRSEWHKEITLYEPK